VHVRAWWCAEQRLDALGVTRSAASPADVARGHELAYTRRRTYVRWKIGCTLTPDMAYSYVEFSLEKQQQQQQQQQKPHVSRYNIRTR